MPHYNYKKLFLSEKVLIFFFLRVGLSEMCEQV